MPSPPDQVSTEEDESSSSSSSSDVSTSTCPDAATPQKQLPDNKLSTPNIINVSPDEAAGSAPAAALAKAHGTTPTGSADRPRRLSQTPKAQPSLLADFFLGRPSQARIQAQRKRMSDAAAVKAEMRTALRRSSVLRLQQAGGVHDRVKKWQKANAAPMAKGNPEAEPSEPTEVLIGSDDKSVTEEDRLRIRARQKKRVMKAPATRHETADTQDNAQPGRLTSGQGERKSGKPEGDTGSDKDDDIVKLPSHQHHPVKAPKGRVASNNAGRDTRATPKKRIVSDEHWMKRRERISPKIGNKKVIPKFAAPPARVTQIPKDFLQRTAQNPTVQNKIRDWAKRVEPPDPKRQMHDNDNLNYSKTRVSRPNNSQSGALSSDLSSIPGGPDSTSRTTHDTGNQFQTTCSSRSAEDSQNKQQQQAKDCIASDNTKAEKKATSDTISVQSPPLSDSSQDAVEVIVLEDEKSATIETRQKTPDGSRVQPSAVSTQNSKSQLLRGSMASTHTTPASSLSKTRSLPVSAARPIVQSAPTVSTRIREWSANIAESALPTADVALDTPTKKSAPRPRPSIKSKPLPVRRRSPSPTEILEDEAETRTGSLQEDSMDSRFWSGEDDIDESIANSYGPSTVPPKSLADIPVGFSAFSDLDLPLQGGARKAKSRAVRRESFKGVPGVFKKVVSEGKKIIHDRVDPLKPVVNQPPNIENWLHDTVDPFIESAPARKVSSAQARQAQETQWKKNAQRRSTPEFQDRGMDLSSTRVQKNLGESSHEPSGAKSVKRPNMTLSASETTTNVTDTTPTKNQSTVTTTTSETPITASKQKSNASSGLKRSGATRITSSPLKSDGAKRPFRELLRDAFRGESAASPKPAISRPSYESDKDRYGNRDRDLGQDMYLGTDSEVSYGDTIDDRKPRRRSSTSSFEDTTLTTITRSTVDSSITASSGETSSFASSKSPSHTISRRRPPPTNGDHELSTIVSVESYSTRPSDTMSTISQSTITQDTAFSKLSRDLSRKGSDRSSANPKRRQIKHPDLVSVLSLPEDSQLPARTRSIRLARSLHRKTSKLDNATLDDLLQEFEEDENIYRRELKTLTSGVIPVLLAQLFDENGDRRAVDMFSVDLCSKRAERMSSAVVNMGVVLEKLSLLHQFVPFTDAIRMVDWLEKVYPVYDDYLDVWRLGFQGIIVNLAPALGKLAEDDSLINVMERNEAGDVLDENGERVDVAYLLRRPLVRIKWMVKFAKGVNIILGRAVAGDIVYKLENLHEKARRRNREEIARKTDEDASSTDATRVRDLRNLAILENVTIDQTRQVNAKDWFDLSLSHSNGQRLECQVELIFRDKVSDVSDRGDILIRESGGGDRSWLLFPPICMEQISACRGQRKLSLLLMIRGTHMDREWYELITIYAELEETIEDWLNIIGSCPVPPLTSNYILPTPLSAEELDVPVGEQSKKHSSEDRIKSGKNTTPALPSRYYKKQSPTAAAHPVRSDSLSNLSSEDVHPDSPQPKLSVTASSIRGDGAPPPPVHRAPIRQSVPISKPSPHLVPPSARVRRRVSSPLKYEYHPPNISSESDSTSDSSESVSDSSSDDDLEEDDVPDTVPGISIKGSDFRAVDSFVSESSITPSNSASQAGLPGLQASYPSAHNLQLLASISYWSNRKGLWKDLDETSCAIVITPGLIEAYSHGSNSISTQHGPGFGNPSVEGLEAGAARPLIALDLTPLVMIRQSTVVDLEIRSPVRSYAKYCHLDANIFRFRAQSPAELVDLYMAVHESRINNAKFKALEEEARFRSFGQPQQTGGAGDDSSSHRRRSWFGRRNSYRASARAPSQSQGSSSSISATSFLRKLTGGGVNNAFNINGSSVDRQSRAGSGGASFYTSSGSSSAGGAGSPFTTPRSPSVSLAETSSRGIRALGSSNIRMRCHLQTSANKWEDRGNCLLTIARPPPGVRQELTIHHGLEKRILIVSIPRKQSEKPLVVVDVVVGSACFSRLAARGIVLNVWEEIRDEQRRVGSVPLTGAISGRVRKWCFQFSSAAVANWVFGLVASEVEIA